MGMTFRTAVVAALTAVLAACGGSGADPSAGPVATAASSQKGPVEVSIDDLLARANAALQANQQFDPPDDNALAWFVEVTERKVEAEDDGKRRRLVDSVAPSTPQEQARQAVRDLLPLALARIEQSVRDGEMKVADRILKLLERARLETRDIERARASFASAHARWKASLRSTDYDQLPSLLSKTMPTYPPRAQRKGTEGWVHMAFVIKPDGSVADVEVLAAEPERVFDRAATDALKQWRFNAPNREIRAQRRMEFKLDE